MKARVKATGEIVEVELYYITPRTKTYTDGSKYYKSDELDFNVEYADPNYWTRLEHQYAGMAMQAMLANPEVLQTVTSAKELLAKDYAEKVAIVADRYATALVQKLKDKEERK